MAYLVANPPLSAPCPPRSSHSPPSSSTAFPPLPLLDLAARAAAPNVSALAANLRILPPELARLVFSVLPRPLELGAIDTFARAGFWQPESLNLADVLSKQHPARFPAGFPARVPLERLAAFASSLRRVNLSDSRFLTDLEPLGGEHDASAYQALQMSSVHSVLHCPSRSCPVRCSSPSFTSSLNSSPFCLPPVLFSKLFLFSHLFSHPPYTPFTHIHTHPRPSTPIHARPRPSTPFHALPRPSTPIHALPRPSTPFHALLRPSTLFHTLPPCSTHPHPTALPRLSCLGIAVCPNPFSLDLSHTGVTASLRVPQFQLQLTSSLTFFRPLPLSPSRHRDPFSPVFGSEPHGSHQLAPQFALNAHLVPLLPFFSSPLRSSGIPSLRHLEPSHTGVTSSFLDSLSMLTMSPFSPSLPLPFSPQGSTLSGIWI
ncbi:unnamed protein product [Closterium sp. NIES-54]